MSYPAQYSLPRQVSTTAHIKGIWSRLFISGIHAIPKRLGYPMHSVGPLYLFHHRTLIVTVNLLAFTLCVVYEM